MNIELDEVVVQDVSDDALEMAAGGARGGCQPSGGVPQTATTPVLYPQPCSTSVLAIADR